MDVPESSNPMDPEYIEKKREELKIFFQDAKFPQDVIDKVIENELKPLKEHQSRPYIAASCPGEVKSEYEVMTGQPFTTIEDCNKPLTVEEIKEKLKGNPIIAEKARQIQIVTNASEGIKNITVPLDQINIASYADMRSELDSAEGDTEKVNKLHYKNMHALMTSVADYQTKPAPSFNTTEEEECEEHENNEREFEAIEKVVSQYTEKSYETRFQETRDMLLKLADEYDTSDETTKSKAKAEIQPDPVLKESSVQVFKGKIRKSAFDEIRENYTINESINISLKDNPVTPDLSGKCKAEPKVVKKKEDETFTVEEVFPRSMEVKLKETEKALRDINSVLSNSNNESSDITQTNDNQKETEEAQEESTVEVVENPNPTRQKFDEKMEQTLQTALEDIFEVSRNENEDNKEMEFKEMKNLARNIVEGAENLSTLIREDITNKLNSMNELLNDVNEALENSRQSNIAYQKIKEESDNRLAQISKVTDTDIDNINSAIKQLNAEIKCHEARVDTCKANYELRNKECSVFIQEVNDVLQKSQGILHPMKESSAELKKVTEDLKENDSKETAPNDTQKEDEVKKERKELWDVEFTYNDERNKRLAEYKQQELERNKRINDMLYDIKDKMKDNKEVLRLANNLLRREETRKKTLLDNTKNVTVVEVDDQAQGDHVRGDEDSKASSGVTSSDGDQKGLLLKFFML